MDTVALYVFIVVQGHITVEWSSATLQLLDWKHKGTGCTKSNSHWAANFDGRGYEVSNDSCCLVIVSCSWLVMVISLVSLRSWVHWSGVKPQSQFRWSCLLFKWIVRPCIGFVSLFILSYELDGEVKNLLCCLRIVGAKMSFVASVGNGPEINYWRKLLRYPPCQVWCSQ